MKKTFTLFFLLLPILIFAQAPKLDVERTARQYLTAHLADWDLTPADVADIALENQVYTKHNGVTHLYFNQRFNGVDLYNAVYNVNILPSGKVLTAGNRFYKDIHSKISPSAAILSHEDALHVILEDFGLSNKAVPTIKERAVNFYRFEKGEVAISGFTTKLRYFPQGNTFQLVWDFEIMPAGQSELWAIKVDALTGKVIDKRSMTIHCSFEKGQFARHDAICVDEGPTEESQAGPDGASYRVFPYHTEAPIYGNRELLTDPAILTASPYGWHDTNGADGAEYTITRGNNVHAYLDLNDSGVSQGDEPDGGTSLVFDFPYDINAEASINRKSAITNLFYMNNFMHDFSFQYGFDEVAGNFQKKNYVGQPSVANDYVKAQGQDGSGTNNANFSTPSDGQNGQMQMYAWVGQGAKNLTVYNPSAIAGSYRTGGADFGPQVTSTPVTGDFILYNNGAAQNSSLGCSATSQDMTGKIAIVDRGECFFAEKAINAQNAGAVGIVIVNFENSVMNMTAPSNLAGQVDIPTVLISSANGNLIQGNLGNGTNVDGAIVKIETTGPDSLDSDFDNGVMAHEYGHGISTRLTGGGQNSACLFNDEQMGEGWSDFFTLATTAKSTDNGTEPRGIGNYVNGDDINGSGIRRYPYSTDLAINPLTYYDILNSEIHALGEVWTACLWDMYWKLVDQHGFSADVFNGTGGNNIAIQLVMDGMKLQPCGPGFIDGRDAILAADIANNNGANQCIIWEAFARRGLGYSASQGSSSNVNDGHEAYDTPKFCSKALTIEKQVTPVIDAGQVIEVSLLVSNFKGTSVTGVVVNDNIPDGTSYVAGSASITPTVNSGVISFDLGTMNDTQESTITYQLSTDLENKSTSLFAEDFETDDSKWDQETIEGDNIWDWETSTFLDYHHSGTKSFFLEGEVGVSDQILFMIDPVTLSGTQPILRFYHRFDTKPGQDGGIVEYSTDNATTWHDTKDLQFRVPYTGKIDYSTFVIPNQKAYWGKSGTTESNEDYIETMLDLSSLMGQGIKFRFHFASGDDDTDEPSVLWSIDDVEIMNMINYNAEACVTSTEGDSNCQMAPEKGTVVNSDFFVANEDLDDVTVGLGIHPNPAGDFVNLQIQSTMGQQADISIINLAGQMMQTTPAQLRTGSQLITLNTQQLAPGMYFVKVQTNNGMNVEKLVIK